MSNLKLDTLVSTRPTKKIYRDGDAAIKLFQPGYSKADVLNEALNQARVEETGLKIPSIREVATINGQWAIVYDFIEGETLAALMKKHPENREAFLTRFVDIQLEMHAKRSPRLNRLKDKMHRKITESQLSATIRYELHTRLESMPSHDKLCHGDFNPSNIIITPAGEAYILDWSHATQGNASADAARTFLLFSLEGEEETAQEYLRMFCEKSDTAMQYVQKWVPIVAASQLVKDKPEQRALLTRWVDVMDYE